MFKLKVKTKRKPTALKQYNNKQQQTFKNYTARFEPPVMMYTNKHVSCIIIVYITCGHM